MKKLLALVAFVLFATSTAQAEDYAVNVGGLEAMTLPDGSHLGTYVYLGGSMIFPTDHVVLIPGLSLEWAPETNFWGFVGNFTADFPVKNWLGLNVLFTIVQDQYKDDWGNTLFLAGPGAGFSGSYAI